MALFLRRPALLGALTAVVLSVPTAALAQSGHPATGSPARRAALLRAWESIHKLKGTAVPAWAAGQRAGKATRAGRLTTGGYVGALSSVATVSPSSAFAVGYECTSACGTPAEADSTLILRWNGVSWSQDTSPSPGSFASLSGVAALSASDAWAVGSYCASGCGTGAEVDDSLVLHYDGSNWTQQASASPGGFSALLSVAAITPSRVWAVGVSCSAACTKLTTLTETLTGTATWTQVTSPSPGKTENVLTGVSGTPGGPLWATGFDGAKSLVLRRTSAKWATVKSPNTGTTFNVLTGAAAQSATNAWAVGTYCSTCTKPAGTSRTLALHWNGKTWAKVAAPNLGKGSDGLSGVTADSASDGWAVGGGCAASCGTSSEVDSALILHWTGKKWSKVTSPAAGSGFSTLSGVSAGSTADAWAVGQACSSGCGTISEVDSTLILHWDGHTWSVA